MRRINIFSAILTLVLLFCLSCVNHKDSIGEKFIVKYNIVENHYEYCVVNSKNDTILILDPNKYIICFSDTVESFIVVAIRAKKGWWGIDFSENILFQVYNTTDGEPSPDELNFDRIRIVDEEGKIGFADGKGKIVIQPQFEQVTAYHEKYAIIGENCIKIPWDTTHVESGCNHYSIECKKYGYIDKQGAVVEIGNSSFEELYEKLDFPKW